MGKPVSPCTSLALTDLLIGPTFRKLQRLKIASDPKPSDMVFPKWAGK